MPRRKPASSKQRKAELQLKRAIKRGDVPAPPPQPKPPRGKRARHTVNSPAGIKTPEPSSKRLQSTFLKVEPEFLARSRLIASTTSLPRPLTAGAAVVKAEDVALRDDEGRLLTCPKRPKWRFDMSKKEVEKNEEGVFLKWINEVDGHIAAWRGVAGGSEDPPSSESQPSSSSLKAPQIDEGEKNVSESPKVLRSPTYYERNLEVWRQFWRASEISQIILLLLDSRCPALHFPPSLHKYFSSLRPTPPLVLVLTKSDLVSPAHTAAWEAWLQIRYPSARVVKVESYRKQDENEERKGQGQRKRFDPEIKQSDLNELVQALKSAHAELLAPPEKIRNDEEKMKKWKPNVRQSVDWEVALRGGRADVAQPTDAGEEYITVGVVGQPNVGKSSLLNALFGTHKVKASRTPGKTKHFQTLFWTPEIRLVDCPGLVMPNFVQMELQVLCGILPISTIPSIPACLHYASRLLPLEKILRLTHPSSTSDALEDKRTWRGERPELRQAERASRGWTTMDVLTAYAISKGWVTAKAGRPDVHRAGNALLRALAEGRIRWAFWPLDTPLPGDLSEGNGIWLGDAVGEETDEETDGSDDESSGSEEDPSDGQPSATAETDSEAEPETGDVVGVGRFDALLLEEDAEESGESEGEKSTGKSEDF